MPNNAVTTTHAVRPRTILLVEDERLIAAAERLTLESFGYSVLQAHTGEEAVDMARSDHAVDLVLMDIDLGKGIDGTESARRILSSRNLPIVFLSSHSERVMVEKVRGLTRYGYIIKNSGDMVLQSSIEMAFELWEAHDALRKSDEIHRGVFSTSPDTIVITELDGRIRSVSPAGLVMFAVDTVAQLLGVALTDFVAPEDRERAMRNIGQMFQNIFGGPELYRAVRPNGIPLMVEANAGVVRGSDGIPTGLIFVIRDVSERRRVEQSIGNLALRYQSLLETSNEGIHLLDSTGRILEANPAFCRMLGYTLEEITQLSVSDIDARFSRDGLKQLAYETNLAPHTLETLHRRKDGSLVQMEVNVVSVSLDGQSLKLVTARDISDRKRSDEARERSSSLAKAALESTVDAILVVDLEGHWVDYNQRFLDMWRIPSSVASEGDDANALTYVTVMLKEPDQFLQKIDELMAQPSADSTDFLEFRDGRNIQRYSRPQLLKDVPIGRVWSFRDITDQTRATAENQTLLKEKDMLLREVHHRIKNNMNTIRSLLRLQANGLTDPSAVAALKEAQVRITGMMLIYDRLYRSDNVRSVDAREYIPELVRDLAGLYSHQSAIVVHVDVESIVLDTKVLFPLGIVVAELVTNAFKYAFPEEGEGSIRVTCSHHDADTLLLSVKDDGRGMSVGSNGDVVKGFGLTLVDMFAEQLAGKVSVHRNGGTEIRFSIPLPTSGDPRP